jgi:hypothetical protein
MTLVKMNLIWNFRCDIPVVWCRIAKYIGTINSNKLFNLYITEMFLYNYSSFVRTLSKFNFILPIYFVKLILVLSN